MIQLERQLSGLQDRLTGAHEGIEDLRREGAEIASHEARLNALAEASHAMAERAAERMLAMHSLMEELAQSSAAGRDVLDEVARLQAGQQAAAAQAAALEAKIAEFARRSEEIDRLLDALAERRQAASVAGMAMEGLTADGAIGSAELEAVSDRAAEVAALKRQVQELMATEDKIVSEALQSKAALTQLLDEARVNLKTAREQKALIDQLNARLASVQAVVQEAQSTLRMLHEERELVERIEHGIRELRRKTGTRQGGGPQPT